MHNLKEESVKEWVKQMKKSRVREKGKVRSYSKSIIRYSIILLLLFLNFILILLAAFYLNRLAVVVYIIFDLLSFFIAIPLVAQERNAAYKLYWMGVLLMFPIVGHIMYILWGGMLVNKHTHMKIQSHIDRANEYQKRDEEAVVELKNSNADAGKISGFLEKQGYPLYGNTQIQYFEIGEKALEDMILHLEDAKDYIFMSFFIIADGEIWERMSEIIERKKRDGVRIYILYDDAGSVLQLSDSTVLHLKNIGIEIRNFNPVERNYQRLFLNFRNHQKMMIIDGRYAYTGGINISDKYANLVTPFGHWKDTGIRMTGDAVYSMQLLFIGMWNAAGGKIIPAEYPLVKQEIKNGVCCQPFSDGPSNNPNNPAMDMFIHVIMSAKERVDIMTPYLIIDDAVCEILSLASKTGIEVRLITPGVADKKIVRLLTQRHYGPLLAAGVRIFEYTPGFVHAKLCANEFCAVIGTINMDFRSFFLHYENGVFLPEGKVLNDISMDFEETLSQCREVIYEEWRKRPIWKKVIQELLYFIKCQF